VKIIGRLILLVLLGGVSLNISGCAKALNPVGNSTFSCPTVDNGVCASVEDVYENRHDIEGYKNEQKYKRLPELKEYIEQECGVEKFLEDKVAYDICKERAEEKYKKLVKGISKQVTENRKYPAKGSSDFLKDVVKAKEGIPIRQPEKVTRIWIAPYENDMGDLVYSHFIYVVENESNWIFTPESNALDIRNNANPVQILGGE